MSAKLKFICKECGFEFYAYKTSYGNGLRNFCSNSCRTTYSNYNYRKYDDKTKMVDEKTRVNTKEAVHRAIRSGKLVRPDTCSICYKTCVPNAHHSDYSKRLNVDWLCTKCHLRVHAAVNELIKSG